MDRIPEIEVWPTMLTPFTQAGEVDYGALEQLVEWYLDNGSTGLFSVCQSSEMFFLTLEERKSIASFVCRKTAGRVPVIASGHISDSFDDQVRELTEIAESGVSAVILVPNRLAPEDASEDVFLDRLDRLVNRLPKEVSLGLYECPHPYKKLMTPGMVRYCVDSGRFLFLKDTSCSLANIHEKLQLMAGSKLRLFNANTSTLLESVKDGAAGYSGVMANIQPKVYRWLLANWKNQPEKAEYVQSFLTLCSLIENHAYPMIAKYILRENGLKIHTFCRSCKEEDFTDTYRLEARRLRELNQKVEEKLGL